MHDDTDYTGKHFELHFLNVNDIEDGAWIEVDGIKFQHFTSMQTAAKHKFSLPASRVAQIDKRAEQGVTETYSGIGIAITLGNYLSGINKNDSLMVDHNYTYTISNTPLLMSMGRLQFHRTDSTEFYIKTSSGYPVEILITDIPEYN